MLLADTDRQRLVEANDSQQTTDPCAIVPSCLREAAPPETEAGIDVLV